MSMDIMEKSETYVAPMGDDITIDFMEKSDEGVKIDESYKTNIGEEMTKTYVVRK